jgi:hypothetical protein
MSRKYMHRLCEAAVSWINLHHIPLVIVLSVAHIGLSCMHARESGTFDLAFFV